MAIGSPETQVDNVPPNTPQGLTNP
ncbi:hypothetical protein RSAG8_13947, partial [Rhizoctonia solani AG-8 WAC10335]